MTRFSDKAMGFCVISYAVFIRFVRIEINIKFMINQSPFWPFIWSLFLCPQWNSLSLFILHVLQYCNKTFYTSIHSTKAMVFEIREENTKCWADYEWRHRWKGQSSWERMTSSPCSLSLSLSLSLSHSLTHSLTLTLSSLSLVSHGSSLSPVSHSSPSLCLRVGLANTTFSKRCAMILTPLYQTISSYMMWSMNVWIGVDLWLLCNARKASFRVRPSIIHTLDKPFSSLDSLLIAFAIRSEYNRNRIHRHWHTMVTNAANGTTDTIADTSTDTH